MSRMQARGGLRESSWYAIKTHADGTVEDLGIVARWHKNPFKRLCWRITDLTRRR